MLLCCFALSSNAQSDTRKFETDWNINVNCDGVKDKISGPVHGHVVDHYNPKTGVFEWYKFNLFSNELISRNTGEVFSVNFFQRGKTDGSFPWPYGGDAYITTRFNLRGDQGTHILVTYSWSYDFFSNKWTFTLKSSKCK